MNKKSVTFVSLGFLAAALVCVVAGIIMYFLAKLNAVLLIIGIFMISMGVVMAIVPTILLIIILITFLINRKNND